MASKLRAACEAWDGSSSAFAAIVAESLRSLGLYHRDLAREFQVAESTVSRWASGVARPHPRIQRLVVASLSRRAGRAKPSTDQEATPIYSMEAKSRSG